MALHTSGEISVDVPQREAFAFLEDPQRLAACIPGCGDLRELAPRRYSAVLSSRVGFVSLSFDVTIEIVKLDPPHAIEATIVGDAIGLAGHVTATAAVELASESDSRTRIRYTTDIGLTGKLGGLGQPVFGVTSAKLTRQFGDNLKRAIEAERTGTAA
jgi:uncharacterized protein